MTAAVTIETGRASDVIRVPNSALRFQPDSEVFAKLGQQPPVRNAASNSGRTTGAPAAQRDRRTDRTGDRRAVWAFEDGRLKRVPVQTGLSDGTQTAITGELNPGARVATGLTSSNGATATAAPRSPLLPTGRRTSGGRS
jgi:HlyD family secretion protein